MIQLDVQLPQAYNIGVTLVRIVESVVGLGEPEVRPKHQARTLRTRLIAVPARMVNHAGTPRWRGPLNWPWAAPFTRALTNLRALPPAPT